MPRLLVLALLATFVTHTRAQDVSISNNLLYDAWLTPNLRMDVRVARHYTLGLTAGYRPWPSSDETTRKWRHLLVSPELRYWTDSVNVHHFFGLNLIYSHYNVSDVKFPFGLYKSVRNERRQGDLGALGLFYGYSWPLGRFWNIEAMIGAAIGYTQYDRYPCTHCGKKIDSGKKLFLMPEAGVSIVYNIPGRPKRVVEEKLVAPLQTTVTETSTAVETPVFIPVLTSAPDFTGRAGQLQKDNPVLAHISQYKPYDRSRVLRKDKRALYVRFPLAKSVLHTEFRDNAEVLERIVDITRQIMADTTSNVKVFQIVGLASIEGPIPGNERLADNRALALQRYIQQELNLPDSLFDTVGGGEAWAEFRDQLEDEVASNAAQADQLRQALEIIDGEPDPNAREQKLRRMNGGRTWAYLKEHILSEQRNSGYIRIYYDYVPDTTAALINRASELLATDCSDCHHEALRLLTSVRHDERAQNPLGVALYLCGRTEEAMDCFRRAASNGNADARENLKRLGGEDK